MQESGDIFSWGLNSSGQLGYNLNFNSPEPEHNIPIDIINTQTDYAQRHACVEPPTLISQLSQRGVVKEISCGFNHSAVLFGLR